MGEPSPPPGWYPDPSGAPGQRYWDGQQWMILDRFARSDLRVASVGLVLFALAAAFVGLLLPMGADGCTSDEQALICTPRGEFLALGIATLGSIAAAAIGLFGTWVAPKRGWFLALGYLGVLASVWVGIEIASGASP
jgi:Protein of unknown function (DUF2510)